MIFQNYCTPHLSYSQQLFEIFISPYFKIIVFHYFFLYILSEVIALNGFERVKEKKKRAIKEATFLLFSERGFNEVKIEHIAKEANVSQVTIYNHFGSKDALFRELIQEFIISEFQYYKELAEEKLPFHDMMQKMIVRKMNTGGLFQPDMLLQMMQRDEELRKFIYSYQNEKILPWYLEILERAQRKTKLIHTLLKK